ncbi:AraC family transcriptional regulator [Paenibacillus sp. JX-17]|uniref:AraC family transcriptional regulator n=1 Tax=Paenibacillus lacisoli TaxID=3064525 RepID=A0ABT9CH08_9BACL|nr:AraC family transcriptional regulator [Paenibacillus sp. JX-17]MDO7907868.1 AraC family transcriptional regulator [Paenibacillus sp. JX-17]
MKNFNVRTKSRLYSRLLTSLTLSIVLTLLVSTLLYYIYYSRTAQEEAFQSNHANLTLTSKEVMNMTSIAQSLSFQIYRNSILTKLLFYAEPNVYDVTAAMSEMNNYLSSMPYIESVYVYNPKSGKFYIASSRGQSGTYRENELADQDILHILDHYGDYKPFTPIPRSYAIDEDPGSSISAYTYLCYDAIGWNRTINSAVIVNVSSAWINQEMAQQTSSPGQSYILDDAGRVLSASDLKEAELPASEQQLISSRIKDRSSDYFTADFLGSRSLISFTAPDELKWQYIRITPYESVTKNAAAIRNAMMWLAGAILLVGLIVSWLLSRILYTPIGQIVSQMNNLETQQRNGMFTIRQNALRKLVLGSWPLHSRDQLEQLEQHGVQFDFQHDYRLVLLRIDEYEMLRTRKGRDLLPYKFAIMNIATEVCSATYRVECVDLDGDSVLVILGVDHAEEQNNAELIETLLRQIMEACREYLKLGLSLTYSPVVRQPELLHSLFRQVQQASLHRLYYGHGSIIDAAEITKFESKGYAYPVDLEKRLVDAMMSGHAEEAKLHFAAVVESARDHAFPVIQLALSRLNMTVRSAADTLRRRNSLSAETREIFPALDSIETFAELEAAFSRLLDNIQEQLDEKRNAKQEQWVRRIDDYIASSYTDPDLCLNRIADELGMSPVYVSRLYKQHTMHTIMDVILEARMRKACELLLNTNESVATIAESTGFTSSSYFHRMFKRTFGITPAEYRRAEVNEA